MMCFHEALPLLDMLTGSPLLEVLSLFPARSEQRFMVDRMKGEEYKAEILDTIAKQICTLWGWLRRGMGLGM